MRGRAAPPHPGIYRVPPRVIPTVVRDECDVADESHIAPTCWPCSQNIGQVVLQLPIMDYSKKN